MAKRFSPILIFIFIFLCRPDALQATKLKAANLEEMVQEADRIFVGTCVAVEDGTAPGTEIPVTIYTFSVSDRIKGKGGNTMTVRQLGVRQPRIQGDQALIFQIPGMPIYRVGQEMVLFLVAESELGLTSPVGLFQGAFMVEEQDGEKVVQNGNQNLGLFKGLSKEAAQEKWRLIEEEASLFDGKKGPMNHTVFVRVLKKMVAHP